MVSILKNPPRNWNIVKISDVLFYQEGPGVRKHQFRDEGVKLLNGGNINDGYINLNKTKKYISEEEAYGKYSHFLINEGDLLIACSGIVVENFHNKIAFVEKEHLPLCLNTSTMRFNKLNDDEIDLIYFKYFLQTKIFTSQLRRLITGSAQLNFGPSHIRKIDLLLPPLVTQKKNSRYFRGGR
jgi:type I restriction enzyme S subunit